MQTLVAIDCRPPKHRSPEALGLTGIVVSLALWVLPSLGAGGLPEPDLVLYGTVRDVSGGLNARLTAGTLSWTFQPAGTGSPVAATVVLTNLNDQFSYVLRIPCETPIAGVAASEGTLTLGGTYDRAQVSVDGHAAAFVQPAQQTLTLAATDRGRIERVDLEVAIGGTGPLPDSWQLQYFGQTGVDPDADPDNDGMDNLGEFRTGTNPLDPGSVFAIDVAEDAPGGPRLTWAGVAGVVYTVQRSQDLITGFEDLAVNLAATPPRNSFQDATASGGGPFFYRLTAKPAGQ